MFIPGNNLQRRSATSDLLTKISFVKDHLPFSKLLSAYNIPWEGDDEHQFSCHFHGADKNPSAHYYPDPEKRVWCFACQEGGDVVWWVRKREGLVSTVAALEFIKTKFGISIDNVPLPARMAMSQVVIEQQPKRELFARTTCNEVNDFIYRLRKSGKDDDRLDRIQALIFSRRAEIESLETAEYLTYVSLYRNWSKWAVDMLKTL